MKQTLFSMILLMGLFSCKKENNSPANTIQKFLTVTTTTGTETVIYSVEINGTLQRAGGDVFPLTDSGYTNGNRTVVTAIDNTTLSNPSNPADVTINFKAVAGEVITFTDANDKAESVTLTNQDHLTFKSKVVAQGVDNPSFRITKN